MRVAARIDVAALAHNLELARRAAPNSHVFAVIKADAYGHGLLDAARAFTQADAFAVACVEEAVELRAAGIDQPLLVLEGAGSEEELAAARAYALEVVVHTEWQLEMLERCGVNGLRRAWAKFDTGMHRLGFAPEQARDVSSRLVAAGLAEPGVLSHLACADEPESDVTARQVAVFESFRGLFRGPASIANSAGVLAHPATHCDWVRPGLMLYGVSPFAGQSGPALGLRPAMTLVARILAIRSVPAGEGVGYGFDWKAPRESRIGIVSIGYGDGYPWRAAAAGLALVAGQRAALAGRVSMDMLGVDLTELPQVREGDPVILWGRGLAVERVAEAAGTSPYELVCSVTRRVPRSYSKAPAPLAEMER